MSDTVPIPIRFDTPSGPVELTLRAPQEAVPAHEVTPAAMTLADALLEASQAHMEKMGSPVSCRKGCTACCHHIVAVTPLEAFTIADRVARMPLAQQLQIRERTEAIEAKLEESGLSERLPTMDRDGTSKEVLAAYFAQRHPCPMLEGDACSIYEDRPAACRQLLVYTPAEECDTPFSGRVRRAPLLIDVQRALRSVSAALYADQPLQMPLTRALKWAEDHEELRTVGAKGVALVKGLLQAAAGQQRAG